MCRSLPANGSWILVSKDVKHCNNDMYISQQVFKFKLQDDATKSAAWIKRVIEKDTYTYHDCGLYRQVMDHHVKQCMKKGDKNGFPIINAETGNVPPDGGAVYEASTAVTTYKPFNTKPHEDMRLLRAAPLNAAVDYVRNEGQPPVQVPVCLDRWLTD